MLQPRTIAVVGGGAWCSDIIEQCRAFGFTGRIDVVHPKCHVVQGIRAVRCIADLPGPPDAAFVGINRNASIDAVAELASAGCGGAVCFASGFSEASGEDAGGDDLQAKLVDAAGEMPILGPNCYGFVNALDGALLWPDQHGCRRVKTGVAILTQSSNIAINLSMQQRGLPISYVVTCGNMAQTSQAAIALDLLDDPRVTAIGLHVEGFTDLEAWYALAQRAAARDVPLVAIKVGKSDQAVAAAVSHTASLAGSDVGADALLCRLGIARVDDLPTFVEALKLLHFSGRLSSSALSSISCSGGEASLIADTAVGHAVSFPALTELQRTALAQALGPMVALGNPLDYHTYIWRDVDRMTAAWLPMAAEHIGLMLIIVDYPVTDAADWDCATQAALNVRARSGRPVTVVATLPELMPADVRDRLLAGGVVAMGGLREAVAAAEAAALPPVASSLPQPLLPGAPRDAALVGEADAKAALAASGVCVPASVSDPARANTLSLPLVVKATGVAHKSEVGGVRLNVALQDVASVCAQMPDGPLLIEEMIGGSVCELLVAVLRDPAHGFVLTVGAGGVLAELWADTRSALVPAPRMQVATMLRALRVAPLLDGYRGRPAARFDAVVDAIMAVQSYVIANAARVEEIEINPLVCTPDRAVAVDALLRRS
ncbi:acetate--CoA ligase family protein [Sulfitobacter sp. S190]|uniref:acetate--CoA ligase family protein n=1 Tax=Sulfitobacter sp. S190 TaxID=2867022 RepID=UPI0021A5B878|nr:acetate--CoA ligase family protein [Sulfitobacter sp. S190]